MTFAPQPPHRRAASVAAVGGYDLIQARALGLSAGRRTRVWSVPARRRHAGVGAITARGTLGSRPLATASSPGRQGCGRICSASPSRCPCRQGRCATRMAHEFRCRAIGCCGARAWPPCLRAPFIALPAFLSPSSCRAESVWDDAPLARAAHHLAGPGWRPHGRGGRPPSCCSPLAVRRAARASSGGLAASVFPADPSPGPACGRPARSIRRRRHRGDRPLRQPVALAAAPTRSASPASSRWWSPSGFAREPGQAG